MHFPKVYNTYFLAIVSTIGGMLFGFDISSMSAIVGTKQYLWYFNNPHGTLQGGIGASLAGGSVIGAIFAGPISDRYGRRDSIAFSCIFWLIGTALQVSTTSVGQLIAGRFMNGITVGITSSQVPVYLAEIAKKEKRGSILVIQQLAIEVGILIMFFIGYGCSFIGADHSTPSFRTAWAMQFVPCVCLLVGLPFLPRSPRWLAKVGRNEEAIDILAKIQAGGDRSHPLVVAEWEEITTTLAAERGAEKGWRVFFKNGMWKRTLAGASVQAWQQLSGANAVTYYTVYIFAMAGLTGNTNLISSGVQYVVFIIFTLITYLFIDKCGRRPLLIWGAVGMGICHFVIGGLLSMGRSVPGGVDGNENVVLSLDNKPAAANTVIAFSYILIAVYALTLAPVAWVYAAEVWSLETRAIGMSLASIANWLFNFAIGFFIPPALRDITWKLFMVFGTLCMAAAVQAYISYPETAKKTLEEIEEMFRPGAPPAWKTKVGHSKLEDHVERIASVTRSGSVQYTNDKTGITHLEEAKIAPSP